MSIITSFFPSIFACMRPQHQSAPLRSESFDFFNSLDFDEDTGRITNHIITTSSDKKRKSKNTFLKSGSKKGKVSLASCIGTQSKDKCGVSDQHSQQCGLDTRVNNDLNQLYKEPESPKSMSEGSDSSSRQLLSSTSSEGSNSSPKRVIRPRTELNFTIEDIDAIKDLTLQLVLSCIQLKESIERTDVDEYVERVKEVCEALKRLLLRVTQEVEQMPDYATEELKKMQMAQTLLRTQMKSVVQTMKQAQENSQLTIADHYTNLFLQSCVHLAVYAKHFLQAFLSISTFVC